jgi:hypothetical protein
MKVCRLRSKSVAVHTRWVCHYDAKTPGWTRRPNPAMLLTERAVASASWDFGRLRLPVELELDVAAVT